MSKPKRKGSFRIRVGHAWDKTFGTSSSPSSPRPSSPTLPASPHTNKLSLAPAGSALEPNLPLLPSTPVLASNLPTSPPTPGLSGAAAWKGLHTALQGLHESTGLFPPLQSAIDGLISCVTGIQESSKNRKEYEYLARELQLLSESLKQHLQKSTSTQMSDSIKKITRSIQEQVDLIASKQNRSTGRRLVELDASLGAWASANRQFANARLEGMNPVKLAVYNSALSMEINRRSCTENTRTDVLSELDRWSTDPDMPNIYWMNGLAGTGKTTIANTFAAALDARKQLTASFFCTRTMDECRDVNRIVPTIAYQLARYSFPFQAALCRVLDKDPDLGSRMIATQFLRLLKEPLMEVRSTIPEGLVVVIDALDECRLSRGVEVVLDLLLQNGRDLPLKFFVTSRPEPNIRDRIMNRPEGSRAIGVLHDIEQSLVQADIELYLREELGKIVTEPHIKQLAQLSGNLFIYAATTIRYLQAGEEIGDLDEHLDAMLSVTPGSDAKHIELDKLYSTVLMAADDRMLEKSSKERMRLVLWTVVCAREPVSVETLTLLAGIGDPKKAQAMLRNLHSVFHLGDRGPGGVVSVLHASFSDFVLDRSRSENFFCDLSQHSWLVTRQCLIFMKTQLRFNICGLETSYASDEQVPNLKERVDRAISPTLAYACRYWGAHLGQAHNPSGLYDLLGQFLFDCFLFWMEAMNLKRWMGEGVQAILATNMWLMDGDPPSELSRFAEDARNFIVAFAANPVSQSTPHLYISALPLWHRSSSIYKQYWKRTRGLITPKGLGIENRYQTILASWKLDSFARSVAYSPNSTQLALGIAERGILVVNAYDGTIIAASPPDNPLLVRAVAFSPDGRRIASGSEDCIVRIWNVQEGTLVGVELGRHPRIIRSVVFSPDGSRIISGSQDGTIRLWSVQNEALINTISQGERSPAHCLAISPDGNFLASGSLDDFVRVWDLRESTLSANFLKGHTLPVSSVLFSPDGQRLVSGSQDYTIRVWDVKSGTLIGTPFLGHTHTVTSLAYSPDGSCIISGSLDCTVRAWRARDGKPIGTPFQRHTRSVCAVAFSPDGTHIVSGSLDHTVRVWNARDLLLASNDSQGHNHIITSVAFSPDGKLIVSGSRDCSLRVWNAHDGSLRSGPFIGHTDWVKSVSFSSDGTRIVSGSEDFTVRMWNPLDNCTVNTPFKGHTNRVTSVAFSPDDKRVVSGSEDCTVRIWSAQEGSLVFPPLEGDDSIVLCVAYSPNGSMIVSGCQSGILYVWNAQDGSLYTSPLRAHTDWVSAVAFSKDSAHIISGSDDLSICVWSVQDGALVGAPFQGHTDCIWTLAYSPHGDVIVSGSKDCAIRLWDMWDSSAITVPLRGHTDWVTCTAFSPDGTRIASGSYDSSIRLWNALGGTPKIDTWQVTAGGWVMGRESQLLFWLPLDLSRCFPTPYNDWVIGPNGPIFVDYDGLLLGTEWGECYLSE